MWFPLTDWRQVSWPSFLQSNDRDFKMSVCFAGFHASTSRDFAESYHRIFTIPNKVPTRLRARKSARRFTEAEFAKKWIAQTEKLVAMAK